MQELSYTEAPVNSECENNDTWINSNVKLAKYEHVYIIVGNMLAC